MTSRDLGPFYEKIVIADSEIERGAITPAPLAACNPG